MMEDLIEGIACYCNTRNQYNALNNFVRSFSKWKPRFVSDTEDGKKVIDEYMNSPKTKDDFKQLNKFSLAEGLGMGYGAMGGALSGAMIATAIAKKKKLNEHKSRLIGALIGSVPGVALGYVGGRLTKGNMFIKSGNEMMPDSYKKLKIRLE